jgi:hypothetical protein
MHGGKDDHCRGKKPERDFHIETTRTSLTDKTTEIIGTKTGNVDPAILWL